MALILARILRFSLSFIFPVFFYQFIFLIQQLLFAFDYTLLGGYDLALLQDLPAPDQRLGLYLVPRPVYQVDHQQHNCQVKDYACV